MSTPSMYVFRDFLEAFLRILPMTLYPNFFSTCAVTVVLLGHLNR